MIVIKRELASAKEAYKEASCLAHVRWILVSRLQRSYFCSVIDLAIHSILVHHIFLFFLIPLIFVIVLPPGGDGVILLPMMKMNTFLLVIGSSIPFNCSSLLFRMHPKRILYGRVSTGSSESR
jgi:hypothetical protein